MVSCQLTRCSFPNNLPMQMMADALWDENCNFDEKADAYYKSAYGDDWRNVKNYMITLGDLIDPVYSRATEKRPYGKEKRLSDVKKAYAVLEEFEAVIRTNLKKKLPSGQHSSWEYLIYHQTYVKLFTDCIVASIELGAEAAAVKVEELVAFVLKNEMNVHKVLEVVQVRDAVNKAIK